METAVSIWEEESFYAPCDIIIVGGGFLGLWSAFELITKKPHLKITIVDRGNIPLGASSRNAGFACLGSPTEMLSDIESMGEDKMWEVVEMRYKGIRKIRQHFNDNDIDFDQCGGYECFLEDDPTVAELQQKLYWLNDGMKKVTGLDNSFSWCNDKLNEFGFEGFAAMIENRLEGGLHSGKLLQALTRKVQSLGVNILTGIKVTGYEKSKGHIKVYTSVTTISCDQLLISTNALSSELIKELCIEPARGQVFITAPIDNLKFKGTFHFNEGYYYFRNVGERLLIGGARNTDIETERSNEFLVNEHIQNELERFVTTHLLPNTSYTISHRWSGIMGFSENKMPVLKKFDDNVYAVVACNGMGVALAPVIAEKIADMLINTR